MNLKKQLFTAFLTVAILPLLVVELYVFATNLMLAFELHEQNLKDSTQIQADLIEENINRLMVRGRQFASSRAVKEACLDPAVLERDPGFSNEILNFTDETLDNVFIFALLDQDGNFIYSSGSNNDSLSLKEHLPKSLNMDNQYIAEIPLSSKKNSLIIYTPVQENAKTIGTFLFVCRTDYLMKLISSHRQLKSSNAYIYCTQHLEVVTSKMDMSGALPKLNEKLEKSKQGSLLYKSDGRQTLAYYQHLSKTPWVLVSTVSTGQIFSQSWNYGLINLAALIAVLFIILFLSRRQSRRVLYPMDQLLNAVEAFFLAGATKFPKTTINPKSEIGYLAEKFSGLSDEVAIAQGKLRESNYLYAALLKATYEFRIVIDFCLDTIECSSGNLSKRLKELPGSSASERIFFFLCAENPEASENTDLYQISFGKIKEPIESEACFYMQENEEKNWYRIVAVPVFQNELIWRVVLHFEDITDQKREELRLIQTSQTDLLCGVYNKTSFSLYCHLSKDGRTDALFFIDLDNFKQVNDTLGHSAGDRLLVSAAQTIRSQFRDSDVVSRFGGDEFVVFAPSITYELAKQKAEKLLDTLSFHLDTPKGSKLHVTASVGVSIIAPPLTLNQAIQQADEAMYQAKENGRAQFFINCSTEKK